MMNSRRKLIANINMLHCVLSKQQAEATHCRKAIITNQYLVVALGVTAVVIALFATIKTPQRVKNVSNYFWNLTKLTAFNYLKKQLFL